MVSVGFGGLGLFERRRNQAAFVGAIDAIPSIAAAYSFRRLRTAYTGSLLRVRRSSDNTEQDIGYTSTGDLDTAAVATFVGAGSGYIVTWYDQSGNGYHATQTTAANQPLYVASGQNGKPSITTDGTDVLQTASVIAGMPSGYMQAVVKINTYVENTTIVQILISGDDFATINTLTGPSSLRYRGKTATSFGAAVFAPANTAICQLPALSWTGTTNTEWQPYQNASAKTAFTTTGLMAGTGGYISVNSNLTVSELIICNAALSASNRQAAEAAANAYWAVY